MISSVVGKIISCEWRKAVACNNDGSGPRMPIPEHLPVTQDLSVFKRRGTIRAAAELWEMLIPLTHVHYVVQLRSGNAGSFSVTSLSGEDLAVEAVSGDTVRIIAERVRNLKGIPSD